MKITKLNDIKKPTKYDNGEKFIALGGMIEPGKKLLGALKSGIYYFSGKGTSTSDPYLEVYPEIGIDVTNSMFYNADISANRSFSNLTEAMKAYNETILQNAARTSDIENAEKCLLRNIPKESPDLTFGYIRGISYRSKPDQVTILTSQKSSEDPNQNTVLLLNGCEMAIVEGVTLDRSGHLDLMSLPRPNFNITDMQEALNQFAIRTKSEVIYGTNEVEAQIKRVPELPAIDNMFGIKNKYDDDGWGR